MSLPADILAEALRLNVLRVVLTLFLSFAAIRGLAPAYLRRLRAPTVTAVLFLLLLLVSSYLRRSPSVQLLSDLRLVAEGLGMLTIVWALATMVFGLLDTRLRFVVPRIVSDLIVASVTIAALSIMLSRKGFNLSSLLATSAVLTAVIGLALQDTLGNMVAGITLQLDSSVRVGDWIKVGDLSGRVSEIRWRYTAIETRNWETVIVPNAQLIKGQVVIQGRRQGAPVQWRRWLYFNVDYRYSPNVVTEVVERALRSEKAPNVAETPMPQCLLYEVRESYYRFAVRYWLTDLAVDDPTDALVRNRVVTALKRAEIPLSMPAQAIFMTAETSERREAKLLADLDRRVECLRSISLFSPLSTTELRKLASALHAVPFSPGEVLTRQGAAAHWLYIVVSGSVAVRVHHGELEQEVARLGQGQYFGEMGLLTGEPRTATVVAVDEVDCYRLGKQVFQELIAERPELVEGVARELAKRRAQLAAAHDDLTAVAERENEAQSALDLIRKMRRFFGMATAERMSVRPSRAP